MENYSILIVEDEVLIAEDLNDSLIELGYDVAAICYDSEDALEYLYKHKPDFVILDINIRGTRDGIQVAEIINEKYNIPFIFLSSLSDSTTLDRAKRTRPNGYLVKPFKNKDLLTTIEMAIYNHSQSIKQETISKDHVDKKANQAFSDKEYAILLDIADGLNNSKIAAKHFVSVNTVKTHVKRIFIKLDVHDRVSAIKKVLSN